MPGSRVGLWLIGAKGGVATTAITGLANLARRAIEPVGLVTALDPFSRLGLVDFSDIVVGGHDIRRGGLADEARRMWTDSRAIHPDLLENAREFFQETEPRLRPGTVLAAGDKIRELADDGVAALVETPRQAIDRIRDDITAFAAEA
ncbi:MAG: inositol-3-phosphate synthase, partial [Planctomycetia bacterium]